MLCTTLSNASAIYREKYEKEFNNFMGQAEKIKLRENWNSKDKEEIKEGVKSEVAKELTRRVYLSNNKFDFIEQEVDKSLNEIGLS